MFPEFNLYSTPLLIFVAQGLIFAFLLLKRFFEERMAADLIMFGVLLIMAFHRTTYTIGFMGWYDTYQNTKINYYLISLGLVIGPLIYLYVRTTISAPFHLKKSDTLHLIPVLLYIVYRLVLLVHDAREEDWYQGYEGAWMRNVHIAYIQPIIRLLEYSSQLIYYAFTIQLFVIYRSQIRHFFSNTYKVELNWIRNFLVIYTFLFLYGNVTDIVDAFIMDLDYIHNWWVHLFSAMAIVYLGIMAYFTDLKSLHIQTADLNRSTEQASYVAKPDFTKGRNSLAAFVESTQAYLNPNLTLKELALGNSMSIHDVSEVINLGFGVNFNEWINQYRINVIKEKLADPAYDHLSLVGIAMDSGFNSKATFNRVFKQVTGVSPSQYKARVRL